MSDVKNCGCSNVKEENKMFNELTNQYQVCFSEIPENVSKRAKMMIEVAMSRTQFICDNLTTISNSVAILFNNCSKFPVLFDIDSDECGGCTVFNDVKFPIIFDIQGVFTDRIDNYFLSSCKDELGSCFNEQDIEWCVEMCYYPSWEYRVINSDFIGEKIYVCKIADKFIVQVCAWELESDGEFNAVTFVESFDSPLYKIAQSYVRLSNEMWGYSSVHCVLVDGKVHIFG